MLKSNEPADLLTACYIAAARHALVESVIPPAPVANLEEGENEDVTDRPTAFVASVGNIPIMLDNSTHELGIEVLHRELWVHEHHMPVSVLPERHSALRNYKGQLTAHFPVVSIMSGVRFILVEMTGLAGVLQDMIPRKPPVPVLDENLSEFWRDWRQWQYESRFSVLERLVAGSWCHARITMRCNNMDGTEDTEGGSAACALGYWLLNQQGEKTSVLEFLYRFEQENKLGPVMCDLLLTRPY